MFAIDGDTVIIIFFLIMMGMILLTGLWGLIRILSSRAKGKFWSRFRSHRISQVLSYSLCLSVFAVMLSGIGLRGYAKNKISSIYYMLWHARELQIEGYFHDTGTDELTYKSLCLQNQSKIKGIANSIVSTKFLYCLVISPKLGVRKTMIIKFKDEKGRPEQLYFLSSLMMVGQVSWNPIMFFYKSENFDIRQVIEDEINGGTDTGINGGSN
jgi:hypothetical protein